MKKVISLLLCILLAAGAVPPARAVGPHTQTIMVYIVGSDLESKGGYATQDITEMLRSQFNQERLTVLVMTGGASSWSNNVVSPSDLSIFKIEGRSPALMHKESARSMGEAETLSFFLKYAVENHPADSYGLVLWDHGAGPLLGFGVDEQHGGDGLTMLELRDALIQSPFDGNARLEWLAFDACLMATVEVGAMMAPHARYLVASEEVLPGPGFDYGFLKLLDDVPLTGDSVARVIIDHTYTYYENVKARNPNYNMAVTLSLVDLDKLAPVEQAVDGLFGGLLHGLEVDIYSDIARSRDASKVYGVTGTTNHYDLIDLYDLADKMAAKYPQEAAAVQSAITDSVLYNRSSVGNSWGLALYFPFASKTAYERSWREVYKRFELMPAYSGFMTRFGDILLSGSLSDWAGDAAPPVVYDPEADAYHIQLTPEQIANYDRAEYYVLERVEGEEYRLAFTSGDVTLDEAGRLTANFDGHVLYVADNTVGAVPVPYLRETETVEGVSNYQIPVLLERTAEGGAHESHGGNLLAELNREAGQAQVIGVILDDQEGTLMGKRDSDLQLWDDVNLLYLSYYLTRDSEGAPIALGDWAASRDFTLLTLDANDGLRVEYSPLDVENKEYYIMMSVVDTQGYAYPTELMPLTAQQGAQAEASAPERPETVEVTFNVDTTEPVSLGESNGIMLTLLDVDYELSQDSERQSPDTLVLRLLLENGRDEPVSVLADWLSVNGFMLPTDFDVSLEARRSAMESLRIPIAPTGTWGGLVDYGITQVEDIRFRFEIYAEEASLMAQNLPMNEVRVQTDAQVGAGYEPMEREPFEPVTLGDLDGLVIQQVGPVAIADGRLQVPLKVENHSQHFDRISIPDSAVNGIMGAFSLTQEDVMPGTVLYTAAYIPLAGAELPPELEEYRYLFEAYDFLEKMGVEQVRDISLRLQADAKARAGSKGSLNIARRTDYVTLEVPGMAGYEQPLDTQGTVLLNQGGLEIVRLDSDPAGKTLYLHNRTNQTLNVYAFGHIWVDDAAYSANMPISLRLAPGASAYHQLFSYLPGIEPTGDTLSFLLSVVDADENRLLFRTERITLDLRRTQ